MITDEGGNEETAEGTALGACGEDYSLETQSFRMAGYKLNGWAVSAQDSANGKATYFATGETINLPPETEFTVDEDGGYEYHLFAVWKSMPSYYVTYNSNGANGEPLRVKFTEDVEGTIYYNIAEKNADG